jgi:hypothetical protein
MVIEAMARSRWLAKTVIKSGHLSVIALLVLHRGIWKPLSKGLAKIFLRQPAKYHQNPQERQKSLHLAHVNLVFLMFLMLFRPVSTFICPSRSSARPPP